jgi:signal transduction histidine kinase
MKWRWRQRPRARTDGDARWPAAIVAFATGLSLATATLVLLAWTANADMRRSSALLLERRASEVLATASSALNRDMKGAWLSALAPMDAADIREDPPYDLLQLTSRAFAHFPYPESFIIWSNDGTSAGRTYAFNRTDRRVPWDPADHRADPYPVTLLPDPAALTAIVTRLRQPGRDARRFALIETTIAGVPYHVVVHRFFGVTEDAPLAGLAAFTVNLDWVRREYFPDLLRQVATINGSVDVMSIAVRDDQRHLVASSGTPGGGAPVRQRTFPLLFVEPSLVVDPPPTPSSVRQWVAEVQPSAPTASAAADLGTQMLLIASLAGAASLVAVLLTVRAVRVSAELATMKSEFVSAVTHELKTPLALIKLVGETLERGRYTSLDTVRDYAAILSQEERRLSHLIENLLTYSRLSELRQMYAFEAVDLSEVLEDALQPFRLRLTEQGFTLKVDVDPGAPRVHADRVALMQVFTNIIDNAIKYSPGEPRRLEIEVRPARDAAQLRFTDTGMGIAAEELPRVTDKFYRGRDAREFGSGLGLAIVRRVVQQHGGRVEIRSALGAGTDVLLTLPAEKPS